MRGKLIVIDGTDGSGKATQTKTLVERIQREGHRVSTVAFPRYGEKSAAPVEEYLHGVYGSPTDMDPRVGSIFFAVDRFAASRNFVTALDAGEHIVLDRYVSANMGHQGCKITDTEKRKAFFAWNDHLEHDIFAIPRPDINIILHVPTEISIRLRAAQDGPRDLHEKNQEYLRTAEQTYLEIASLFPQFHLIECAPNGELLSRESIHEKIWQIVEPMLVRERAVA